MALAIAATFDEVLQYSASWVAPYFGQKTGFVLAAFQHAVLGATLFFKRRTPRNHFMSKT